MIDFNNARPLSDFSRDPQRHIRRLKKTGRPQILTVAGQEEVVVQDAAAYRKLLEALDQSQAVAGIRRGLRTMGRGEGRPMRQALETLGMKHGVRLRKSK